MIKQIKVTKPNGLRTTECAMLAQMASKIKGDVYIVKSNKRVNGKSIMGLLSLNMKYNDDIHINITNDDNESKELIDKILKAF